MTEQDPKPSAYVAITDRPDSTTFVSRVPSGATTVWTLDLQEGKLLILSGVLAGHQIEGRFQPVRDPEMPSTS